MIRTIATILEAATSGLAIATRNGLVEVADFDGKKLPSKRKGKAFIPVVGDKYGSLSYWRQPDKIRSRIVQGGVGAEEEVSFTLRWVAILSREGEGPCEDIGGAMNAVRQSIYLGKGAIKSTLSASFALCEVTSIDINSERVYKEELGDGVLPMQWRMVAMDVAVTIRSKPGCLPSCLDIVIPTVGAVPVGCVEPSRICGLNAYGNALWDPLTPNREPHDATPLNFHEFSVYDVLESRSERASGADVLDWIRGDGDSRWAAKTRPMMIPMAGFTWTNMPPGVTFQAGSAAYQVARPYDLSKYTQVRYTISMGNVAGSAGSNVYLRYVTAYNGTASNYVQLGASEVQCATTGTNTIVDSGWIDLAPGAITTSTFIAVLGSGGNNTDAPTIGNGTILFR